MAGRVSSFVCGVILAACAPGKPDGESASGGGTTTGSGESTGSTGSGTAATSSAGPVTSSSGTSTTGTGSTGAETTGDSSTTGATTGGPESVCDPQPESVLARFVIDDDGWEPLEFVHHCTVAGVTQGASLVVELSGCKADPGDMNEEPVAHTLTAEVMPAVPLALAVGDEVVLSVLVELVWWRNRFFTLRRPSSELVLAGLDGPVLPGDPSAAPIDYYEPFRFDDVEVCAPEPVPPPEPSGFIMMEPCYRLRREALRVEWSGGATVELIDRSAQEWPDQPYWAIVERAEYHDDDGFDACADQPGGWFRLMFFRTMR